MRRLFILAVISSIAAGCGPSAPPEPFFGDWKVTSALTPGVSAVAKEAAGRAVGTAASFSGRTVRYGDHRCDGPTYTRRWLAPATFTEAYRAAPVDLGLTGPQVEFVDITCTSGSLDRAATLMVRPDGTLLTMWDGAFYVLTRQ